MEALGALSDEADSAVQAFVMGIVHAEADGGQDARTPLRMVASCLVSAAERSDRTARRLFVSRLAVECAHAYPKVG